MCITKKAKLIGIVALMLIMILGGSVSAITPMDTYACSRGVCVYYYIEGGSSNSLYQRIKDAAYNWEHTGCGYNPIYLYEKSSSSGTAMDIYNKSNSYFGSTSENMVTLRTM